MSRLLLAAGILWASVLPGAPDPAALRQGQVLYLIGCGGCHGADARGGRGADLSAGRFVHAETDEQLHRLISQGIPGTEMPGTGFGADEVSLIIGYLRSLAPAAAMESGRGNISEGERRFRTLCSGCHRAGASGGSFGPALTRITQMRPRRHIIESIREPSRDVAPQWQAVTLITRDGGRIVGARRNEDLFSIQVLEPAPRLRALLKAGLAEIRYEPRSLMPAYGEQQLSPRSLDDVLAYLESLSRQ
jgi:putative heme-binding domain-containing protein